MPVGLFNYERLENDMFEDEKFGILNEKLIAEGLRDYLGLSTIGTKCHRALQYQHYWAYETEISTRIKRLFAVGHDAEHIMIADLAKLGIIVRDQQKEIIGAAGHWKGHIDGQAFTIKDGDFLVELKTHNDKSFKELVKLKVKLSKPTHYGQMQSYMGYLGLCKGLYMALNKNDSTYYFEWVEFDEAYFKESMRKEMEVILADTLLPRIGTGTSTWFECKFCDAKDVCFGKSEPLVNCRTCAHVDVLGCGVWECTKFKKNLSSDEQREGCAEHEYALMFKS